MHAREERRSIQIHWSSHYSVGKYLKKKKNNNNNQNNKNKKRKKENNNNNQNNNKNKKKENNNNQNNNKKKNNNNNNTNYISHDCMKLVENEKMNGNARNYALNIRIISEFFCNVK